MRLRRGGSSGTDNSRQLQTETENGRDPDQYWVCLPLSGFVCCCLSYGIALGFTARNCAGVMPPFPSGRFEVNCSVSVSVLVETICILPSPAVETKMSA